MLRYGHRPDAPATFDVVLADRSGTIASPTDDLPEFSDLHRRFVEAAIAGLEAVAGSMRVLALEAPPTLLSTWLSGRVHSVIVLDPTNLSPGRPAQGASVERAVGSPLPRVAARCEQLPFADGSFDIVVWVPALEGVPPGNDRVILWDIGRVLKPNGRLILTLEVSAPSGMALDSHSRTRTVKYAPTPATVRRLLDHISQTFVATPADVPVGFEEPTSGFIETDPSGRRSSRWFGAPTIAGRSTLGAVLKRRTDSVRPSTAALAAAYLEGQAALEALLGHVLSATTLDAQLIEQLQLHIVNMAAESAAIQVDRDEMTSLADERLAIVREQGRAIEDVRSQAEARLALTDRMTGELNERLRLLEEAHADAADARAVAEGLLAQLEEKDRLIADLTADATDRLELAERLDHELHEREQVIQGLKATAAERLDLIERLHTEMNRRGGPVPEPERR